VLRAFATNAANKWFRRVDIDGVQVTVQLDLSVPGRMDQYLDAVGEVPSTASNYERWM
jgi:glucose-6-phosphate 1-dehydrogenase